MQSVMLSGKPLTFKMTEHSLPNVTLITLRYLLRDYSDALYCSYDFGGQAKEFFYWLLNRADRQDLEAAKSDWKFSKEEPEFRQAVNQASQIVGPVARTRNKGPRTNRTHEKGTRECYPQGPSQHFH